MKRWNSRKIHKAATGIVRINWRQHEFALVTVMVVVRLGVYCWHVFHLSAAEIDRQYAGPFADQHVPFNLYRNIILPDWGMGLLLYLSYLWLNFYTLPGILPRKDREGKNAREYIWAFVQVLLLLLLLGIAWDIALYCKHEWQFHYPGFSIFFNKNNPRSQLNLLEGFINAGALTGAFILYAGCREMTIDLIERSRQRAFNIQICNRVTAFVAGLVCLPLFLSAFNIVQEKRFYVSYFLIVPALFAMFISNVYWLFPMTERQPFFSKKIIIQLLLSSCIYALPLTFFVHETWPLTLLYCWIIQLFVVTPATWWYYQNNKNKILQLRTIEEELVRSKADLQFLRSQINPHFLFNALNTLYGTALQENAARTSAGIQKLGDMMRFMLHENTLDFIDMNKEVEYLGNYIELQKLRTQVSPQISIEDNINDQDCNVRIAPMLLIPFVENAFKHGISLAERSWIKIHLTCSDEAIVFEVRNSMHRKSNDDPEKNGPGIGIRNVEERLKMMYPGRYRLYAGGDGKEYTVLLTIQPGKK